MILNLIMEVHLIQHCWIEITTLANPLNASAEGPEALAEGGHKLWIKGQGATILQELVRFVRNL